MSKLKDGVIKDCLKLQEQIGFKLDINYYEENYNVHELSLIRKFMYDLVNSNPID